MFSPKPNIPYKFVFQDIKNNLVESHMIITFSEENNIYLVEQCFGFTPYECYDTNNYRFVCYMDNTIVLNSCIILNAFVLDSEAQDKINSFDISKIYLEDELIWSL
jgi:hypothetical protein